MLNRTDALDGGDLGATDRELAALDRDLRRLRPPDPSAHQALKVLCEMIALYAPSLCNSGGYVRALAIIAGVKDDFDFDDYGARIVPGRVRLNEPRGENNEHAIGQNARCLRYEESTPGS